jgi:WhiB family redox-sensing transcriptional regulator
MTVRPRGFALWPPEPNIDALAAALAWQEQALCAQTDPEAFFPEKGGSTRQAKQVCRNCPVRAECLAYALAHDERFGVWGGLSERERRALRDRERRVPRYSRSSADDAGPGSVA